MALFSSVYSSPDKNVVHGSALSRLLMTYADTINLTFPFHEIYVVQRTLLSLREVSRMSIEGLGHATIDMKLVTTSHASITVTSLGLQKPSCTSNTFWKTTGRVLF